MKDFERKNNYGSPIQNPGTGIILFAFHRMRKTMTSEVQMSSASNEMVVGAVADPGDLRQRDFKSFKATFFSPTHVLFSAAGD